MATKSAQGAPQSPDAIEELLDTLDVTLDRVKVLYEQYFLGIQKQPPTHLHGDVERKLRDLTQLQIRNTGLRYRFATLQQKFGSYNAYWRRTVRQIENGTYVRSLSKIGRDAAKTGQAIPEEILAAMPKRMREQVKRDREAALAIQRVRDRDRPLDTPDEELLTLADEEPAAFISEPTEFRRSAVTAAGAHVINEDPEFNLDAYFQEVANDAKRTEAPPEPVTPPGVRAATIATGRRSSPSSPPLMPAPQLPRSRAPSGPPAAKPAGASPQAPRSVAASPGRAATSPAPPPRSQATPIAPSQVTRPNPIVPGSSSARPVVAVESMSGPFPRAPTPNPEPSSPAAPARPSAPPVGKFARPPTPRPGTPPPEPAVRPPPGMTDADVNVLFEKYVKAKELVGEHAGPGSYGKLLRTINAQAPKIMAQYQAKGVEFAIVVKDNQVIIKAKPKP